MSVSTERLLHAPTATYIESRFSHLLAMTIKVQASRWEAPGICFRPCTLVKTPPRGDSGRHFPQQRLFETLLFGKILRAL